MAKFPFTPLEVRQALLEDRLIIGSHARFRIDECNITDVRSKIHALARTGIYSECYSQKGRCAVLTGRVDGSDYRLILAPHWTSTTLLFAVTFYRMTLDCEIGQNFRKFGGGAVTYFFNGAQSA